DERARRVARGWLAPAQDAECAAPLAESGSQVQLLQRRLWQGVLRGESPPISPGDEHGDGRLFADSVVPALQPEVEPSERRARKTDPRTGAEVASTKRARSPKVRPRADDQLLVTVAIRSHPAVIENRAGGERIERAGVVEHRDRHGAETIEKTDLP